EPGRRREEARALVAPRSEERMLHHRQELDVCEPHALDVIAEAVGELAIRERPAVFPSHPGTEVDLVDGHRSVEGIAAATGTKPFVVAPVVAQVPHDGRGLR